MKSVIALFIGFFSILGCQQIESTTENTEMAQQIGDLMASADEAGGSDGTLSWMEPDWRAIRSVREKPIFSWSFLSQPAFAASCSSATTFGSCSNNTITRDFNGCTIGTAKLSGLVTLTWGGSAANCLMVANGDSITRSPNFMVTGGTDATLRVSKTGTYGQKITRVTASTFTMTSDGIRRLFTSQNGETVYDFTSETTSALSISGTSRSNRTLENGTLRVTNNTNHGYCDFTPSAVAWVATCNCPSQGKWVAVCSDGQSARLTLTGCGRAALTVGSADSESITFDRCYGI